MDRRMKMVFASDSFKGSLSGREAGELLEKAARQVFGEIEAVKITAADGGEGTVEALLETCGGEKTEVLVHDARMRPVSASYGMFGQKYAVIEMAEASGLPQLPDGLRNPLKATSYGTGELLRDALEKGFSRIVVGLGGSATNDGGMGAMRALGARFLDGTGAELEGCGQDLEQVQKIDLSGLHPRLREVEITVMCDVDNPLCGAEGATHTFGAQKGGMPEMLETLEAGMLNYRRVLAKTFGKDPQEICGGGAAGGLGAALALFCGGRIRPGVETVLDMLEFDRLLEGADLVVTGEGRTDGQTVHGKVMYGIGRRAKERKIPVIGLSGSLGEGAEELVKYGICAMTATVNSPMPLEMAMARAKELYFQGALNMFRLVKVGMGLR